MIIYFVKEDRCVNFDNIAVMRNNVTEFKRHYLEFVYPNGESYKYVFWGQNEKKDFDTAVAKIRDAFKKRKRYIEIDG